MMTKKPLWQEILNFSSHKYRTGIILIFIGLLGLVLPVIPGIVLIGLGLIFLKPDWYDRLKNKFNERRDNKVH
jgi:preprotein translocase subunit Sss1